MTVGDIPERDWKIVRELKEVALQRFCQRALDEVSRVAADASKTTHERYGELFKLLKERDEEISITFNGLSRSSAILKLYAICRRQLLTDQELARFSAETRRRLEGLGEMRERLERFQG